jgi:hypothetical protein
MPVSCRADSYHTLFDHPLHYRRVGAKGPLTWKIGILIGRPYNVFDEHGTAQSAARTSAAGVALAHSVGIWARRDLSAWFPGATSLVIAARGLPDDPERFGFIALAEAAT